MKTHIGRPWLSSAKKSLKVRLRAEAELKKQTVDGQGEAAAKLHKGMLSTTTKDCNKGYCEARRER